MDIFFEIQRKKTHIMCDAKETNTVFDLKRTVEGILKVPSSDQQLKKQGSDGSWEDMCEDNKTLMDYGFSTQNAKAQQPAVIALCFKTDTGEFDPVQIDALSTPPPLPDVMRQAEKEPSNEQVAAAN